jgi:mannose-1-phosphate guanylyltransferase
MNFSDGKTGPRFAPVILAGGSGTRFWPRSRRAHAKQVLALDGERTMIQQTLERLLPLTAVDGVWVITNKLLNAVIEEQLPLVSREKILAEPMGRNTAPACALAAFLLEAEASETVIGIFPSDHVVKDTKRFAEVVSAGIQLAASGERIVVLGIPPTRAETGYGYIELGETLDATAVPCGDIPVRRVKRFTEKPDAARAEKFVASGNYAWNGGIFLWSARTLADAIREHCPEMVPPMEKIVAAYAKSPAEFKRVFTEVYPQCREISIDYAVLEPRSAKGDGKAEIYCLPADFAWNDLGSWNSLYENIVGPDSGDVGTANVSDGASTQSVVIDAQGNYVYALGKVVALIGVTDLVVVETTDALLITTRDRAQDVGKVVAELKARGRYDLI